MTGGEIAYLILVVVAMGVFAVVLAWAMHHTHAGD